MNGIGLEIEDQGRAFRRARFSAVPSAAREREPDEDGRQRRGDPMHSS
jgi:hypothetical protein